MKRAALLASLAVLASAPARADVGPWTVARLGMPYLSGSVTGAGVSVVVGDRAEIWSSADGSAWSQRTTASTGRYLSDIVYGDGRFVAVGYRQGSGLALVSADGRTWSEAVGTPGTLRGVTYGAGQFVAVGTEASALRSADGGTWTAASLPAGALSSVAYGAGLFVAVGEGRLLTSPDAVTWTDRSASLPPGAQYLSDLTWTGSRFVAAGLDGIATSTDGVSWTQVDTDSYIAVGSSGTIVVAVAFNGYATSPTGDVWTPRSFPFAPGVGNGAATVSFGSGRWLVAGVGGLLRTSSDGLAWTNRTLPGSRMSVAVAHGAPGFCATARYGGAANSPDGTSWSDTFGPATDPGDLLWTGSRFVSANFPNGGAGHFQTSVDCASWTTASWSPPAGTSQAYFFAAAEGASLLVAVGFRTTSSGGQEPLTVASTDDGSSWATVPSAFGATAGRLEAVAYGSGQWVAVGYAESPGYPRIAATSPDGLVWTAVTPIGIEANAGVFSLAHGAVGFLAAGSGIWTSPDGVTWTRRTPMGDFFYDVAASPYGYAAAGSSADQNGVIAVSSDGLQWTAALRPSRMLRGIAFSGAGSTPQRVVAVGESITLVAPVVPALAIEAPSAPESAQQAAVVLRLSFASSDTVTVAYQTGDVTAVAGIDYTPVAGVVTFPTGTVERPIVVPLTVDGIQEGDETFRVTLTQVSGAVATAGHADVTILDTPTIAADDSAVPEGDTGSSAAGLAVRLSHSPGQTVTVAYATGGGTATPGADYTAASGTLTFTPGTSVLPVPVSVLGDVAVEPDETFVLSLSSATNASLVDATADALIQDDDAPPIAQRELAHGMLVREDFAAPAGEDVFRIAQAPRASYEVVVDGVAGDASPVVLERLAADNATVLDVGAPVGTGTGVSLRFRNGASAEVANQHLRLRAACGPACDAGDVYRVSAYETTLRAPRFSNVGGQVTLLVLQNPSASAVDGLAYFWSASGALLLAHPIALAPRQTLVVNAASLPALVGRSGSVTVAHTAPFGVLAGKAVALEPATGFGFDTPLAPRPR
jgi:Calx-beta domain-containing protein